jgi:V/A-type H+/Na+-transporting ATPase subunit E
MPASEKISSGVQQLIDRLRGEGVAAGEQEAERLVERAKKQAAQITSEAKKQADDLRAQARADIEQESEAAIASVQLAVRDTVLTMRSEITARFQAQVKRLVTAELRDPETLRRLVLAVAGRSVPEEFADKPIEIEIAESMFGGEETDAARQRIDQMVLRISAEMLREGVEIKPAGGDRPGIRVRLAGEDVEVDLTDEAISEALIAHLLPRYRSIVAGIQGAS